MKKPEFDLIEVTALKFAATFYEASRSSGLKPKNPKHDTPHKWALHNFEKFIPKAVETLLDMLSRNDIAENIKEKIYLAIMERTNDKELQSVFPINTLPNVDVKKIIDASYPAAMVIDTKPKRPKTVIEL